MKYDRSMAFAKHLLVPTDFSAASKLAISAAAVLSEELGARVTVVHVHDTNAMRPPSQVVWHPDRSERLDDALEAGWRKELEALRSGPLKLVEHLDTAVIRDDSPPAAITRYAEEIGADLIVMATHGRTGLKQLLIGSVAEKVVRTSPVPVLTLRSKAVD